MPRSPVNLLSRRVFIAGSVPLILRGCSAGDLVRTATSAISSGSLAGAARSVATSKAVGWAANPKTLSRDFENFEAFTQIFLGQVATEWGNEQTQKPTQKVFVKYSDAYKSRGVIDFGRGIVRVETLVPNHLKQAVVTTLLSPEDPQSVDLFSDKPVKLGGVPFLYNQVVDQDLGLFRWDNRVFQTLKDHQRAVDVGGMIERRASLEVRLRQRIWPDQKLGVASLQFVGL